MACDVCNQTMQNLGIPGKRVFRCGWCGTVKEEFHGQADDRTPVETMRAVIEPPGWIRHLIQAADFRRRTVSADVSTSVPYTILAVLRKVNDEHPTLELRAENGKGHRVL